MVRFRFAACLLSSVLSGVLTIPSVAQVQADPTLGTLVNNSPTAPCTGICDVTGGAIRGSNLFHSLQQFSLPGTNSLDIARFLINPAIQNVIVRVTGGAISTINGTIATVDATPTFQAANFFLLNPSGVVFGPNARIFVGGSFLASTADRLLFPEGEFSTSPAIPPLLTVSAPIGLGFTNSPPPIRMNGATLSFLNPAAPTGFFSGFALVGGDVVIDGGGVAVPDSRLELGGLRSPGTVGLTLNQGQIQLAFPTSADLADVTVANLSGAFSNPTLSVGGEGFGAIALHGRNITISGNDRLPDAAFVFAGIDSNQGARDRQSGAITMNAREQVHIHYTIIGNSVLSGGIGNSGRIEIQAKSVHVSNNSLLNVGQTGIGNAGNVFIQAQEAVRFDNSSIGSNLGNRDGITAQGKAGEIYVSGKTVSLLNEAQFQSVVFSGATATGSGRVSVWAQDGVTFTGGSAILANVNPFAVGNSSTIEVQGRSVSLEDSFFSSVNAGQGNTGDIRVRADEVIRMRNSLLSTDLGLTERERQSRPGGELARGQVGNIELSAPAVVLDNGALLTAAVFSGTATQPGLVSIRAEDVLMRGTTRTTGIFTNVFPGAIGNGSTIQIDAGRLTLEKANLSTSNTTIGNAGNIFLNVPGQLTLSNRTAISSNIGGANSSIPAAGTVGTIAFTAGNVLIDSSQVQAGFFANARGNPGMVKLDVRDSVIINNQSLGREIVSGIFTNSETGAIGNGSDIQIKARQLFLTGFATLEAGNSGQGNAGNINLAIQDTITLDGDVSISSRLGATGIGQGGRINVATPFLSLNHGAEITVGSAGQGSAGDLNISAGTLRLDNNSSIQSNALQGDGGNIFLRGDRFLLMRRGSSIQTAAGLAGAGGNGGNIFIDFPFVISAPNENNDIIANAFDGQGGRITINARNIYWFQTRSRDQLVQLLGTTDARLLNPRRLATNDITAFSQNNPSLSGQVILNTPDLDPSRGLSTLPVNLVDPSQQINQACQPDATKASNRRFVITGRGGLPTTPDAALTDDRPLVDLVPLVPPRSNQTSRPSAEQSMSAPNLLPTANLSVEAIVEAQAWVQGNNGEVYLVAQTNAASAEPTSFLIPTCASQ
ncbi:MAG: filamentous hemagglutinin N-terminal domain-containing protein [Leptolyngbyaceae cyanobacterium bins.302]|nr:filamentous hemagglutinin N-terminal domain-containing protein [Leptolyngbyaceae cyanobacterium bins.302]